MPYEFEGMTLPAYVDPADVPAAMRALAEDVVPRAGGVVTGPLALQSPLEMSGQKITNVGGPTAPADVANRQYVDAAIAAATPTLPIASTTQAGIVKLNNTTTSTSTTEAATANAVRAAAVLAGHAHPYAATSHTHAYAPTSHTHAYAPTSHSHAYLPLSGGTVTGQVVFSHTPGIYIATAIINGLGPGEVWQYNNSNGQIRWMGVGVGLGQSHGASSETYKKAIKDIDPTKGVFTRLRPIHFQYRKDFKFADRWDKENFDTFENNPDVGRMGFSYEQVQEVAPHWVYETDGLKAVSYDGMMPDFIAWATAAIQKLMARVDELEAPAT